MQQGAILAAEKVIACMHFLETKIFARSGQGLFKQHRRNWEGPTANSLLCSKHFEQECFAVEGSRYRDAVGIPAKKRLKPDAIPTIFPKLIHGGSSTPTAPTQRPTSEKRQRKAVSN